MNETEIYNIKRFRLQQTVEEINMKKITQKDRVLQHLRDYGSITTWESFSEYSGLNIISMLLYLYGIESPSKSGLSNHLPVINYLD